MIQSRIFKSSVISLFFLLSILTSCVTTPGGSGSGNYQNMGRDPRQLYNGPEDLEKVLKLLEKQNQDSWDFDTRYFYSSLLLVAQRREDARAQLIILKEQSPENRDVLLNLAILDRYSGNEEASNQNLDVVLKNDPGNVQANVLKGKSLVEKGDYTKAKNHFVTVLQKESDNLEALIGLADCLMRTDEEENALRVLDKAIDLYPEDPYLRVNRSRLLNADRKFSKAYRDLTKAIEVQPENAWHYLDRARIAMFQFRDLESALKDLKTSLDLGNDNLFVHYYMAEIYDDLGDYSNARIHMTKALEYNEDFYYAYETFAKLLYITGEYDNAFQYYLKAYQYFEENNSYLLMAFACKYLGGEIKEASRFLQDMSSRVERGSLEYELFRFFLGVSSSYAVTDRMEKETNNGLKTRMTFFVGLKSILDGDTDVALKVFNTLKENHGSYEYELAHWYLSQD